jgi:hypothetical protein
MPIHVSTGGVTMTLMNGTTPVPGPAFSGRTAHLVVLHAALMGIAFVMLLPLGALAARHR